MWNLFTQSARRTIWHIDAMAQQNSLNSVEPLHILLALLIENNGISAQILQDAGMSLEVVKIRVLGESQVLGELKASQESASKIEFSALAKQTLELACDESRRMNLSYIGTEHLLLGLLRQKSSLAITLLSEAKLNLTDVRSRVQNIISA